MVRNVLVRESKERIFYLEIYNILYICNIHIMLLTKSSGDVHRLTEDSALQQRSRSYQ